MSRSQSGGIVWDSILHSQTTRPNHICACFISSNLHGLDNRSRVIISERECSNNFLACLHTNAIASNSSTDAFKKQEELAIESCAIVLDGGSDGCERSLHTLCRSHLRHSEINRRSHIRESHIGCICNHLDIIIIRTETLLPFRGILFLADKFQLISSIRHGRWSEIERRIASPPPSCINCYGIQRIRCRHSQAIVAFII